MRVWWWWVELKTNAGYDGEQYMIGWTSMYILALCKKKTRKFVNFSNGVCTDHNDIYLNKTLERPHVWRGVGGCLQRVCLALVEDHSTGCW